MEYTEKIKNTAEDVKNCTPPPKIADQLDQKKIKIKNRWWTEPLVKVGEKKDKDTKENPCEDVRVLKNPQK